MLTVLERFEQKYVPEPNSGCYLWTAAANRDGYGHIKIEGKNEQAPRVAWRLYHGAIPAGLMVLHTCDTPACVNPDHLFLGTGLDNMEDKVSKGRQARGEANSRAGLTVSDVTRISGDQRSLSAIAAEYGISKTHVSNIKRGVCWKHVGLPKVGRLASKGRAVHVSNGKLGAPEIDAIRSDPRSQREIAKRYGVSQSTISRIKAWKIWTFVSQEMGAFSAGY